MKLGLIYKKKNYDMKIYLRYFDMTNGEPM